MKFSDEGTSECYVSSDFTLIMHLLRCGVVPVETKRDGRRVHVYFPEVPALECIRKTAADPGYTVLLSDVTRADIIWKGILDGTK